MHVFWLNGSLMLEPENDSEGTALEMLAENLKLGRPKRADGGTPPHPEAAKEHAA